MIIEKTYISLIGLFLLFTIDSCGQIDKHDSKEEILILINNVRTKSVELFEGWNIWERSNGIVFNYEDKEHELLFINNEEKGLMFKEIYPDQDSTFYPLNEINSRSGHYPFKVTDFPDRISLFKELKVNRVESISNLNLIMFINEDFSVIYSKRGTDIRYLSRFNEYKEFDNYWYYYVKE